ncbi:MAG: hypothetical protein QHJ73_01920 [Armatimonadota bacterium]|jgi:hypothetical protein|nr:hypothetical protein [Armatimonadota bacterium]
MSLAGAVLCAPLFAGPISEPGALPGSEPDGPYRLVFAFQEAPEFNRPVTLVLKVYPLADVSELESTEAQVLLPEGVKRTSGLLKAQWRKPPRSGEAHVLRTKVVVSPAVFNRTDPCLTARVTSRRRGRVNTQEAVLYLLSVAGRPRAVSSFSIAVRLVPLQLALMDDPFDVVMEATAPIDIPRVRYAFDLWDGFSLLKGTHKGEFSLREGEPRRVVITLRADRPGQGMVGVTLEGAVGRLLFRGDADLLFLVTPDAKVSLLTRRAHFEK